MARNYYQKLDGMEYDGLISGVSPETIVAGKTIRKLDAAATLARGTVLAKSSGTAGDGKLVVLGTAAEANETLTADCVLCDAVDVGTAADVNVSAYISGCFNPDKLAVASGYTMTEDDKDKLRERGIILVEPSGI